MTYQATGAVMPWLADKVTGLFQPDEVVEKAVDPGVDLVRIWAGIAVDLKRKYGTYGMMQHRGMAIPRFSLKQMDELKDSWYRIGDKVFKELSGRPELMNKANQYTGRFIAKVNEIRNEYLAQDYLIRSTAPFTDGGQFVWFPTATAFYDAVSRYMIELNSVIWAVPNVQSRMERWVSVLPWGMSHLFQAGWITARDITPAVKEAVDQGVDAAKAAGGILGFIWRNRNWLILGGAAVFTYAKFGPQINRGIKRLRK